ncbi:TPA: hypothetical protein DEG21_02475 [Patescibacteria group bacterium]|nr:hypothetical protein [Candidatus Gracilibacteria bacterium]HBY74743.1 hypothetical protein [Candidatus Gracilibacteria bacterium]
MSITPLSTGFILISSWKDFSVISDKILSISSSVITNLLFCGIFHWKISSSLIFFDFIDLSTNFAINCICK